MLTIHSVSVENIHRIQRKPPKSGPELLEHQHMLRDNGIQNAIVKNPEAPEYETTNRSTQTIGPVEKKYYHRGDPKMDPWGSTGPNQEKSLERQHKNVVKTKYPTLKRNHKKLKALESSVFTKKAQSEKSTSDVVGTLTYSFVNIVSILGNQQSNGSGFWIAPNYIVTAAHVVFLMPNENYTDVVKNVQVGIYINDQLFPAQIIDFDVKRDFAIIYVDAERNGISEYAYPVNLGNSSDVRPGESILLLGNPLPNTVSPPTTTQGIVSVGSDVAGLGMFVVDAEALEGMSGGMAYSMDRNAVVGIVSGYFSNNTESSGTTLTICAGIDSLKNHAKEKNIPFLYHESNDKSRNIFAGNYGGTIRDHVEEQQNESVGGGGGPGQGRVGKNPKKNFDMFVTQGPGKKSIDPVFMYPTTHTRENYMERTPASSPLDSADPDIKNSPRIKNREHLFESRKGEWVFNIPLGYKNWGKNNVEVYKNGENYHAYFNGHEVARSSQTEKNTKPLISLMKQIRRKFDFDSTYENYIQDFGVGMIQ